MLEVKIAAIVEGHGECEAAYSYPKDRPGN
jgi:hypothetical protein